MSESSSQDKTEQPSQQKLRKAREEGNLPRSRELVTALLTLGATLLFGAFSHELVQMAMTVSQSSFQLSRAQAFDPNLMLTLLTDSVMVMIRVITPLLGLLMAIAVLANIIRGGWNLSGKAAQPKFSKLNPISGIKKIFSAKSVVELVKSILKVTLISVVLYYLITGNLKDIIAIQRMPLNSAMAQSVEFLMQGLLSFALALLLIALLDLPYSSWDYTKQLKMTKQEAKEEHKNTDGNPEIKGRIRQLQRQMTQRRMMNTVPQADVVITNPTHYAVALKYDLSKARAPYVIAKAVDHSALHMQAIARQHDVPVVEVPPLTRAVYYSTNEWQEIPAPLYIAVAHILTFVFQMEQYRQGRQPTKPPFPRVSIPRELRR